jgi:hypothetical protein
MPLNRLIQLECDCCGHCDYSEPPEAWSRQEFIERGYRQVNGRWYCDSKCKDNHWVKLREEKQRLTITKVS